MATFNGRTFVTEVIEKFKEHQCLWMTARDDYTDKQKRNEALDDILRIFKAKDPRASRETVQKKLYSIRGCYNKELRKVKAALAKGEVHIPKLWYYNSLSFLKDQDTSQISTTSSPIPDDVTCEEEERESGEEMHSNEPIQNTEEEISDKPLSSPSPSCLPTLSGQHTKKGGKKSDTRDLARDVLIRVNEYFKRRRIEEDRFDLIGKTFAIKLRGLPKQQMLLAEKLINETIFQAEMGSLTLSHRLVG